MTELKLDKLTMQAFEAGQNDLDSITMILDRFNVWLKDTVKEKISVKNLDSLWERYLEGVEMSDWMVR